MKSRLLLALALLVLPLALLALPAQGPPSVTLAWDVSPDPSVASYNVYYGVQSRTYTNTVSVVGRTNVTCTIPNLARGVTYFFAATCVSTNGLESDYSAEVSYRTLTVPQPPPNFRINSSTP